MEVDKTNPKHSHPLIKIAITPFEIFNDEHLFIIEILNAGWDYVHLRHPAATTTDMRRLIENIPQCFHGQLKLHGHFELLNEFNLGGIHLNSRCPQPPPLYNGSISKTCHNINEIMSCSYCDYVTLSPIFDSISKVGYLGAFTKEELNNLPNSIRVIALGGVTPTHLEDVKLYGFAGYAVLGYLFQAQDITELKQRLKNFE